MSKPKTKTDPLNYTLRLSMTRKMHDRISVVAGQKNLSQNSLMRQIIKNYLNHQANKAI